jgi:hypothetical protein
LRPFDKIYCSHFPGKRRKAKRREKREKDVINSARRDKSKKKRERSEMRD